LSGSPDETIQRKILARVFAMAAEIEYDMNVQRTKAMGIRLRKVQFSNGTQ